MKTIWLHIRDFRDANDGQWPDRIEDVEALVSYDEYWDSLMNNPSTGDNPGYEYVKPTSIPPGPKSVVLYQLEVGKRASGLEVLLVDGSLAMIDELSN